MNLCRIKTAAVAALALAVAVPSEAELLLTEDFNYSAGGLYGTGGWLHHGKNTNEPIQLVSPALTYAGYQDAAVGLSAKLIGTDATTAHERLQREFADNDHAVLSGSVYLAALVNVTKAPVGEVYFMGICQRGSKADAGIVDEKSGSEYPRLFAGTDTDGNTYLGVSKNGAATQNGVVCNIELNTTYLVVLQYTIVEGSNNDEVTLYVNPDKGRASALATLAGDSSKADASTSMGLQGITLRQGSTSSSKIGPDVLIDAVRVATTWEELWTASGGGSDPTPDPTAAITAPATVDFGSVLQYQKVEQTINVRATGLTGDITVSSGSSEVAPAVATIPMADAMSDAGYDLTLAYTASATALSASVTLAAEGVTPVEVALTSAVTPVEAFANFRQIANMAADTYYYFSGKATATYVDASTGYVYVQDLYGGGAILDPMALGVAPLKRGDRFSKFYCVLGEASLGVTPLYLLSIPEVTATDVEVMPAEVTLGELARDPSTYVNRLVAVADVSFGDAAGTTFTTAGVDATDASGAGRVRAFSGTDLIGAQVPERANVVGISTSASAAVVTMRSSADLTSSASAPSLEVTTEMLADASACQKVGATIALARLTVAYANMAAATPVYLTGANADQFAIDVQEIPAGTGTATVTVSYSPTAAGNHTATVSFDATPTELFASVRLSAKAIDDATPPTISVDASALVEFVAAVGQQQQQTISYTTANLLDYGSIALSNPGAFTISSTMMLKNETANLVVTFKPTAEGAYSEQITFAADGAEPVVVTVTGRTSSGGDTPAVEGDEFTASAFSTANPHALLVENFESMSAAANKPLHIDQWTNVALTGTRAWWAYEEADGNHAAKVTAYDFNATESAAAQMLLITPCLDFVNAAQPLLAFRVKGLIMTDDMIDNLQVVYIDPNPADASQNATGTPLDNVWMADLGVGVPAGADYNDQWVDFVVDLKGQDIADRFFIGFAYTSERGKASSTSYLLDDVSWGRSDIAFIRPSATQVSINAVAGKAATATVAAEGLNLTGDITVTVAGDDDALTAAPATLPAAGGSFTVSYCGTEAGEYTYLVTLSADGAPAAVIVVNVVNAAGASAIDDVAADADAAAAVRYYNLQGVEVRNPGAGTYLRVASGRAEKVIIR